MDNAAARKSNGKKERAKGSWRGVITTGIYCRSSCGSRVPHIENLRYFRSSEEALSAGFRPCRRCRPNEGSFEQRHIETIAEACRLIDQADSPVSVSALAHAVGVSEGHFHRLFRSHTGMTPRAYAEQKRMAHARNQLERGRPVTETLYDAGYGSSSRFYAITNKSLGMTPSHFKDGGSKETLHFAVGETSLGAIVVASSKKGIAAILMGDDPETLLRDLQDRFPKSKLNGGDAEYEGTVARVVGLIEAPSLATSLPLDIRGTVFQRRVWHALQSVPVGETISYDEIARRVGHPRAVGAVASACASNPLAVAIPCHRVVRHDGTYFGYTWGLERKRVLLDRESKKR
ncbi:bifunctional DNA-binding transcriptional regulator/O6-methylguanine-DNA methyltransferase Ada [Rhizobium sp.]|uniref:bifunctional DNA-binding transcriptional regulator/O6-methylguanine-DNA methyltransferase Ada n=1 Tax=Rhizobium sp. TaxID=391 RepID=UPI0028B015ED